MNAHPLLRRLTKITSLAALAAAAGAVAPTAASAAAPATPSRLHVSNGAGGTFLTWASGSAGHFQIEQATDPGFRIGRRVYTDRDGRDRQFTPFGLARGGSYYWRIRAVNGSSGSHWSAAVHAAVRTAEQPVRVMQYNVSGELAWAPRAAAVVGLIRRGHPDAVAFEEAAGWVGPVKGPRIADDIVRRLGSSYRLARTEIPPGQPGWFRTGNYIAYNVGAYRAVGSGGHWRVGDPAFAVYQALQNRATGARFLFVGFHLSSAGGRTGDALRQQQMQNVIGDATSYAASHGHLPVVYAGDTNSHDGSNHAFDGPGVATRAAHIADAFKVAQSRVNARYDSANNGSRVPSAFGRSIDRVFTQAGVGIASWQELLDVSGGHFVGVIPSDHNPIVSDVTVPR